MEQMEIEVAHDPLLRSTTDDAAINHTGTCSVTQVTANLLNFSIGTTLLAVPWAVARSGWVLAAVLILVLAIMTFFTGSLLVLSAEHVANSKPNISTQYPSLAEHTLGPKIGRLVGFCINAELALWSAAFVVMGGSTLQSITHLPYDPYVSFALFAACVFVATLVRDLGRVAFLSAIGATTTFALCGAVAYYSVHFGALAHPHKSVTPAKVDTAMQSVGTIMTALSIHIMLPSMRATMREPQHFPAVMRGTMVVVLLVLMLFGGLGYVTFGDTTAELVNNSFPQTDLVSLSCQCLILASLICKSALTAHPLLQPLDYLFLSKRLGLCHRTLRIVTIRVVFAGCCYLCALAVPTATSFLDITGSVVATCVVFVLPCLIYLRIFAHQVAWYTRLACVLVIATGITCGAAVIYTIVLKIVARR
eukprot:TRINITY_DN10597_c0_g2_i1.p2 TRINITY_DN10597_c0_g2~~TRINITY_DN10597_c0_g2_i1.p2  ORF type:complete len:420 (-),score=28.12 TRINITY_DN10597_c0_g2_i1:15-1274(-)